MELGAFDGNIASSLDGPTEGADEGGIATNLPLLPIPVGVFVMFGLITALGRIEGNGVRVQCVVVPPVMVPLLRSCRIFTIKNVDSTL